MPKQILVAGVGSIGKRFLQAIHTAGLGRDVACYCYDTNIAALETIGSFLRGCGLEDATTKVYDYQDFLDLISDVSLVIVATTARRRVDLLLEIVKRNPRYLIIEKPVTQTEAEYEILLRQCNRLGIAAYVHYHLRFQPYAERLKSLVDVSKPLYYSVTLPGNGMACNGIHFIDFFLWLSSAEQYFIDGMTFRGIYEQKREGFWDLYGDLNIKTNTGGLGRVDNSSISSEHIISVSDGDKIINVYEDRSFMSVIGATEGHSFAQVDTRFASDYLVDVMRGYMDENWQDGFGLTELEDAFQSHQILFEFMRFAGCPGLNIT
jgi:predicted dehydrogenase